MSNIKMMHNKHFDDATLSTVGVNELMPIANVQTYDGSEAFRTDTLTNVVIRIKSLKGNFVSGLALWRHNLSTTATVQWRGYTSVDWTGSPVIDTGLMNAVEMKSFADFVLGVDDLGATVFEDKNPRRRSTEIWHDAKAVVTQEIIINDPDNTFGYIDIERIFNGLASSPRWNFSEGAKIKRIPVKKGGIDTADGGFHTIKHETYRVIDIQLNWLHQTDWPMLDSFYDVVGNHEDFYISMYPNASPKKRNAHAFAAKFLDDFTTTIRNANFNGTPMKLREV
ncbi:hypothetical protein [Cognaticolwellia mytili]|uniref:hypothetical protein n=1 Tax=Cognaticolwellia mytili TaxID=1888913 RepID=UPI000A176959|nr:hypothetical protein [Cognaticolwellia mytili]